MRLGVDPRRGAVDPQRAPVEHLREVGGRKITDWSLSELLQHLSADLTLRPPPKIHLISGAFIRGDHIIKHAHITQ